MGSIKSVQWTAVVVLVVGCCGGGSNVVEGPLGFSIRSIEPPNLVPVSPGVWGEQFVLASDCGGGNGNIVTTSVSLTVWEPDGGQVDVGTFPVVDAAGDLDSGYALIAYSGTTKASGVGGSVTLTQVPSDAGGVYAGSFATMVLGTSISGEFSFTSDLCDND
jgi:hypothetical protein